MDLKKEIKLSDLFKRPARPKQPGTRSFPETTTTKSRALSLGSKGRELVGLKIGASQLAASRVSNNGSAKLLQLAREPLAAGIVAAGEVRDVTALAAALNEFFAKHSLPRKGVRLGVATNRIGVRSFEMAGIEDDRQLDNAIKFRAHEAVSIPVDQAILDYHVVTENVDSSGSVTRRIVLAAAYRDSIERYAAACTQAKLQLVGVDLEAFGLLRAVAPPAPDGASQRAAVVAVTVGHDRTTLAISDGTVCDFTRVLEWGGATLSTALERALVVSSAEADELKLSLSLAQDARDGDDRLEAARHAVRQELRALARELISSLHFYQSQPDSLELAEILVTGGTTRMPGFVEELERLTRVRVRAADPLAGVAVDKSVETGEDLPSLAVAIGLGVDV